MEKQRDLLNRTLPKENYFSQYWCHFDMLRDDYRNKAYDNAIQAAIKYLKSHNKHVHTIDIGTGSGLLALLAQKHGSDQVTAVEEIHDVAQVAKQNFSCFSNIHLIEAHSSSLKPADLKWTAKPNIVVSEILDTDLIGEGVLPSLSFAIPHLCRDMPIVIPAYAKVYGLLVTGEAVRGLREPYKHNPQGIRYPNFMRECRGSPKPEHMHIGPLLENGMLHQASKPFEIFQFDFANSANHCGEKFSTKVPVEILEPITQDRNDVAVVVWWDCGMLPKHVADSLQMEQISMATTPNLHGNHHSDHWRQAVYPIRQLEVSKGDTLLLRCSHDEFEIWFQHETLEECSCRMHSLVPREYWRSLSDPRQIRSLENACQTIVQHQSTNVHIKNPVVVCLGCSPIPVVRLAKLGNQCRVVSWCTESKFAATAPSFIQGMLAANGTCGKFDYSMQFDLHETSQISSLVLQDADFVYVIYHPSCLDAGIDHIEQFKWFENQLEYLSRAGLSASDCLVLPAECSLEVRHVSAPTLETVYAPVESVRDVSLLAINQLRQGLQFDIQSISLGQYPHTFQSEPVVVRGIGAINCSTDMLPSINNTTSHSNNLYKVTWSELWTALDCVNSTTNISEELFLKYDAENGDQVTAPKVVTLQQLNFSQDECAQPTHVVHCSSDQENRKSSTPMKTLKVYLARWRFVEDTYPEWGYLSEGVCQVSLSSS